jgi:DNA-binding beta-propeller fold protein YncE
MGQSAANVQLEVGFDAPEGVRAALAAIGRTEDVRFAPSGRRLAIACFVGQGIALADVAITVGESGPEIAVTSFDLLESTALNDPHGVDFVDDDTLVVANRGGGVAVLRLPSSGGGELTAYPVDGEVEGMFQAPGSVAVRSLGEGHHELLVCNNSANTVTRHVIDGTGALVRGEIVLRRWLDIPDGLTLSHDGQWLAVSNHNTHTVFLYERSEIGEDADPVGILRGVSYPHGIRFAADDSYLVVADAGAPYVHVFVPSGGDWEGVGYPAATITVMDDDTFLRGRHNPQEGGPKGIDLDPRSGVLVATSQCQPLAFFDLPSALDGEHGRPDDALVRYEIGVLAEAESVKAAAAAEASALHAEIASSRANASALQAGIDVLRTEVERVNAEYERSHGAATESNAQLAAAHVQLTQVHRSKSWRLTAPMRSAFDVARRLKRR